MGLIYFIFCAYGMTQMLVYGTVFKNIRPKHHFFHCPMCMGFWVGVFLVGINKYTELFTFDNTIINYFLLGCLSSGTSYVLCTMFGDNGVKYEHAYLDR
jgi:steroid 5-alpha reductase family enzyme